MDARDFGQVELIAHGGVPSVKLNRPERCNALGGRMFEEHGEALDEVEEAGEARDLANRA